MNLIKKLSIGALSIFASLSLYAREDALVSNNNAKYLVGTISIASSDNRPLVTHIEGIQTGDILVLPTEGKKKEVRLVITEKNLESTKIRKGNYFVYRIPQAELDSKGIKTNYKKVKYLKNLLTYEDGTEPEIEITGDEYGDSVRFDAMVSGFCTIYAIDINSNEMLYSLCNKNGSFFESKFLFDLKTQLNVSLITRTLRFVFVDTNGVMTVSPDFTIYSPSDAKITTNKIKPYDAQFGKKYHLNAKILNPNKVDIEYSIYWGDSEEEEIYISTSHLETEDVIFTHVFTDPGESTIIISARELENESIYIEGHTINVIDSYALSVLNFEYERGGIASFSIINRGNIASTPTSIRLVFMSKTGDVNAYNYDIDGIAPGATQFFEVDMSGEDPIKYYRDMYIEFKNLY